MHTCAFSSGVAIGAQCVYTVWVWIVRVVCVLDVTFSILL